VGLISKDSLIAEGRTAEVYAWNTNQVVKLFHPWCPTDWVDQEIESSRAVSELDVPTPRFLDVVEIDGRHGIVYERADGPSMNSLLFSKPWTLLRHARQLATLHTKLHSQQGQGLSPLRESLRLDIQRVETLPCDLKNRVLQLLDELPDGNALCHLDFHPEQVIVTKEGSVIIDWMTACQGHPLADVARTAVILKVGQSPTATRAMRLIANLLRGLFYRTYMSQYLQLNPQQAYADIRTWMIPVAAGRLREDIPGERDKLLSIIQSHLALL
jgi:thiamine kinase